jgi:ABC-type transport system involved in multi-copper enzyme maturation permease subunit
MKSPDLILAIRHLARDTFRQSLSTGLFWVMIAVTVVCTVLCLSVSIEGDVRRPFDDRTFHANPEFHTEKTQQQFGEDMPEVNVLRGRLYLAFGAVPVDISRDREDTVHFLELALAAGLADSTGLLLILVWTAGFLPSFLDPNSSAVLLAKPVPRWSLLAGKYCGVLAFVGLQAFLFVFGTWTALGLKTNVWDPSYLLCIPILILHFAAFYSVSALLAVFTRNAVTCMFGSVSFWFACLGLNYWRHALVTSSDANHVSPVTRGLVEAGYWLVPKPGDFGLMLYNALNAERYFARLEVFRAAEKAVFLELSILTSLLFAAVVLWLAAYRFVRADY